VSFEDAAVGIAVGVGNNWSGVATTGVTVEVNKGTAIEMKGGTSVGMNGGIAVNVISGSAVGVNGGTVVVVGVAEESLTPSESAPE